MFCPRVGLVGVQPLYDLEPMMDDDLTCKDVARILKVSAEWVRDRCSERTFPHAYKLVDDGPWRIPRRDVDAYRESRQKASVQAQ